MPPRSPAIAAMAFFTLVDLFATQAILPALARVYAASPRDIGFAVNASTLGMALASLGVATAGARINRRNGVTMSLVALSVPTSLLAFAPNLLAFAGLRVAQGLCMATAFALTLAEIGERTPASQLAGAFAAYVTGNVASNLFGRLIAAGFVQHLGVGGSFLGFAALNLIGAGLAFAVLQDKTPAREASGSPWGHALARPELLSAFGVGFCILFAFVGTFSYVNFVLARPPFSLGMMQIGVVYLVFAPSLLTTPLAGRWVAKAGGRGAAHAGLGGAALGVLMTLSGFLPAVLFGLALIGVGTFLAQAVASGFAGRAAGAQGGAAGALYLASYFTGGVVGAAVLGRLFDAWGWAACQLGVLTALAVAAALTVRFEPRPALAKIAAT